MTAHWKRRMQICLLALGLLPGLAASAQPDPTGNWERDSGTVRISLTRCGDKYCAVNTWVKRPDGPEKKGDELILTVKPVSDTEYKGTAYDVRRQRTFSMTITLEGDHMETTGCVLAIVCKGTGWKKLS